MNTEIQIEDIDVIEQLDDFKDEYVYDLEVEDTHNFFANDILAHNSIYYEFGRITNQLNIPEDKAAATEAAARTAATTSQRADSRSEGINMIIKKTVLSWHGLFVLLS